MNGHDYEYQVAKHLRGHGYTRVTVTKGSGDFGVDVIAHKGGHKYAIQCKYYSNSVGLSAVQEAVAGMAYYKCDRAMVVTNSTFTKAAYDLALANHVLLLEGVRPVSSGGFKGLLKDIKDLLMGLYLFLVLAMFLAKINFLSEKPFWDAAYRVVTAMAFLLFPFWIGPAFRGIRRLFQRIAPKETENGVAQASAAAPTSTVRFDKEIQGMEIRIKRVVEHVRRKVVELSGRAHNTDSMANIDSQAPATGSNPVAYSQGSDAECKADPNPTTEEAEPDAMLGAAAQDTPQTQTPETTNNAKFTPPEYVAPPIELLNRSYDHTGMSLRDVWGSDEFKASGNTAVALGRDSGGKVIMEDIATLPHLLIAGAAGTGKSTLLDAIILSLVFKNNPTDIRLILIDPSSVQFGVYNGLPHLLVPVVQNKEKAYDVVAWCTTEEARRQRVIADANRRSFTEFNDFAWESYRKELPRIVIVIDGLSPSMLENSMFREALMKIVQTGHKVGIHLVVSLSCVVRHKYLTNLLANVPSRAAFNLVSSADAKYILGQAGAESLGACGDMLLKTKCSPNLLPIKTCVSSFSDVANVSNYFRTAGLLVEPTPITKDKMNDIDELLPAAVEVILETGQASVSMLQRRLKLGYARAACIMDEMEERGIVGPFEGSKLRQLLITKEQWQTMQRGIPSASCR